MNNHFAKSLIRERQALGISPEELSGRLGVSTDEYVAWENGSVMPPVDLAAKLAAMFGTTVEEMMKSDYIPPMRMGAASGEPMSENEKQREWADYEQQLDNRCARGRKIVKTILIVEIVFLIASFFGRSLLSTVLNIVILVFLWRGKSWARYVYVGLSVLGVLSDALITTQLTDFPGMFVFALLVIVYRVATCILLCASKSVDDFLSDQNSNY